jgi:hypothetical protein
VIARLALALLAAVLVCGATATCAIAQTKAPGRPQPPVHQPTSDEAPQPAGEQQPPGGDQGEAPRPFPIPDGSLYGGGVVGRPSSSGKTVTVKGGTQLVSVSVAKDRKTLSIRGDLLVRCADAARVYAFPTAHDVSLSASGKFAGSSTHADSGSGGRQDGTWSFSGRFRENDYASGTARLVFTATFADGTRVDCDTGKLRFVVRDASRRPGAGDARADRTYYGLTGQNRPIALRTSPKGSSIAALALGYSFAEGKCQSGRGGAILPVESAPVDITRRRSLVSQTFRFTTGARQVTIKVDLSARFGRARVSGSLRVIQEVRENGARVDQCKTGKVSWQAER